MSDAIYIAAVLAYIATSMIAYRLHMVGLVGTDMPLHRRLIVAAASAIPLIGFLTALLMWGVDAIMYKGEWEE